jgi:cell volume regulation protein A
MLETGNILLIASILLLTSILAGKTTSRFGVPTLIFFLIIGVLAGSEGIVGIYFNDPYITEFIGVVALNFILFSGGLDTNIEAIKPVLWKGITLSTAGVFLTAITLGLFVHLVFDFTMAEGLLLGSIVSSTDAAAVFSILRRKGIRLKSSTGALLELESGSNDPMAYFLTITFTAIIATGEFSYGELVIEFFKSFLIGGVMGITMGKVSHWVINRIKLDADGLYPVLMLGLAIFTYSITDFIGGNGFLAIYLCALVLGNSNFIHKKSMVRFYEGQAWLMQIVMFLTLGLLVFPSQVIPVMGQGLLISAFLILVARPVGVFLSLLFFKSRITTKLFVSWVGLRGAVPIIFATYPLIAGIEKAGLIFNLVFFISVSSVLLQGTTLGIAAKWLGVSEDEKHEEGLRKGGQVKIKELFIMEDSKVINKKIVDLQFPLNSHIMTIKRDGQYLHPNGSTRLQQGDRLFIVADNGAIMKQVMKIFEPVS